MVVLILSQHMVDKTLYGNVKVFLMFSLHQNILHAMPFILAHLVLFCHVGDKTIANAAI